MCDSVPVVEPINNHQLLRAARTEGCRTETGFVKTDCFQTAGAPCGKALRAVRCAALTYSLIFGAGYEPPDYSGKAADRLSS
jgi:hypothetical protein